MRKTFATAFLLFLLNSASAQVGIGTSNPNASAQLDVESTNKGFLPPRMTAGQRDAISSPAAGLVVWCNNCGTNGELQVFNGSAWTNATGGSVAFGCGANVTFNYKGGTVTYGTVLNATTGKCWLDRNLGATQVATSSTDAASYGDLFQWGRGDDGHQIRTSSTSSSASSSTSPGSLFLTTGSNNWYNGTDPDVLWQGVNGANNPCPSGWHVPSIDEWTTERNTWSTQDKTGAFNSPLKFSVAGQRSSSSNGQLFFVGNGGYYWSSSISGTNSRYFFFGSSTDNTTTLSRAIGNSVRCIRD